MSVRMCQPVCFPEQQLAAHIMPSWGAGLPAAAGDVFCLPFEAATRPAWFCMGVLVCTTAGRSSGAFLHAALCFMVCFACRSLLQTA